MFEILLIEDDRGVRESVTHALLRHGFNVHVTGRMEGLCRASGRQPDAVVLGLGAPDPDATMVLRLLRATTGAPVVVVTARRCERSMVDLLYAGADDYIVQPFSSDQIVARIGAVLRRAVGMGDAGARLTVGRLHVDTGAHTVHLDDEPITLNRREFDLLAYLAARPGTVVGKRELLREVWRHRLAGDEKTVYVHICWLRRKLGESAAQPRYLHTVRGIGVMLQAPS